MILKLQGLVLMRCAACKSAILLSIKDPQLTYTRVALANNHVRIVQASILGSVLVNLLLILGSALLVGGAVNSEPTYNTAETQLLACLLFVSVFTFLMPVSD